MPSQYVQYGCGLSAPPTWRNFDSSPTLRLEKSFPFLRSFLVKRGGADFPPNVEYGDITRGLPLAVESCEALYCSHVLEHLALDELRIALRNTYSYLRKDGIFRFVFPDLEWLAKQYINSEDSQASITFMRETILGKESRPKGIQGGLRAWLGGSAHLWLWDFKSISIELETVGFRQIRRATFHDSAGSYFADVESADRWQNYCLGVECVKGV